MKRPLFGKMASSGASSLASDAKSQAKRFARGFGEGALDGAAFSAGALAPVSYAFHLSRVGRDSRERRADMAQVHAGKMQREHADDREQLRTQERNANAKAYATVAASPILLMGITNGARAALQAKHASEAAAIGHVGRKLIGAGLGGVGAAGGLALMQGSERRSDRDLASVGAISPSEAGSNRRRRMAAVGALGLAGAAAGAASQSRRLHDYLNPKPTLGERLQGRARDYAESQLPGSGELVDAAAKHLREAGAWTKGELANGANTLREGVLNGPAANGNVGLRADLRNLGHEGYQGLKNVPGNVKNKASGAAQFIVNGMRDLLKKAP